MRRLHAPIYVRRVDQLVSYIAPYLRQGDRVLDVGCGSGALGRALMSSPQCPRRLRVQGLERVKRDRELIPIEYYRGGEIPYAAASFDVVILADVLHHDPDPHTLIGESSRVAKRFLVIKDHKVSGFFARPRIALADWAANRPYDMPCLYRYNSLAEWRRWYQVHGLAVERECVSLHLYPPIVNLLFGRALQYFAVLRPRHRAPEPQPR